MYRERWHFCAKTQAGREKVLALAADFEQLAAAKGWAKGTFWSNTAGDVQEVVGEWDYPDLAAYQQEYEEYDCPEMAEIFARFDEFEVTRPIYTELLETVTVG
jgi:hypothetical protein